MKTFFLKRGIKPKGLVHLKGFYKHLLCVAFFVLFISNAFAASADDSFIAGYATAILEHEFGLTADSLRVKDGIITLKAGDIEGVERDKIITALTGIRGVLQFRVIEPGGSITAVPSAPAQQMFSETKDEKKVMSEVSKPNKSILSEKKLFEPLIADPRWPHFSAAYHYYLNDKELNNVGSTSFGETFTIYTDNAPFDGQWQLGIQAAVFAIFDLDAESKDLVNADYWVGFPISYRTGNFSALFRIFHQSSHLGDEYLLRSRVDRVNLSYESLDLKISYDFYSWFRTYAGSGFIFNKEPSDLQPWLTQFGLEFKSLRTYLGGIIRPVAGADFKNWQENNWDTDMSIRLGVQIESAKTVRYKNQLMLEYFKGHSPNGQFYERSIEYLGLGTHFYF